MKLRTLSAALIFLLAFPLAAEIPFSAEFESYIGDLFFPVFGADGKFTLKSKKSNFSENQNENSISASGGFFSAKPDLSEFSADFNSGFGKVEINSTKLDFSVGAVGANLPGETKILSGKPRFVLEDGDFVGVLSSAGWNFSDKISMEISGFALNGNFDWGDLYYFYGHPDKVDIFGGKFSVSLPFDFEFFAYGGKLKFKIKADNTENEANLGNADAGIAVFGVKKELIGQDDEKGKLKTRHHTLKAGAVFARADFSGKLEVTSKTQNYAFFPYKRIDGSADGKFFAAGGGFSYKYSRSSFEAGIDAAYLHCFSNPSDADYSYQYKKNIFFDGSSGGSDYDIADFSRCGIFAGKISLSYDFKKLFRLKRASPVLKLSRIFALPVLTDEARDKIHGKSSDSATSSSSSDSTFSSSSSDSGLASSKGLDKLKTVLLAGTLISLKIEY